MAAPALRIKMAKRLLKILPAISVIALAYVLAFVRIDDPDVWWHLKCGELFLRDFHVPRTEIFSYTATGRPWVDGYLPAQVILYLAWRVGGPAGVGILGAALVAGAYALALWMSRRSGAGYAIAVAASLPAVFLARGVMLPRPALLTPVFALLTLWLLEDHRRVGGRRIYWIWPVTVLWANCHPGFLLGPIITAIYLAGSLREAPLRKRLGALLAGQFIATLINPYGHRIYYSAVSFFLNPQLRKEIIEWEPLYGAPAEGLGIIPSFVAVAAIGLLCLLWSVRRGRIEHALLFVFIALSTVFGRRNLIVFGPLSVVLISWIVAGSGGVIGELPQRRRGRHEGSRGAMLLRWEKSRGAIVTGGAVLITVAALFLVWFNATNRFQFSTNSFRFTGLGVQPAMFPVRAVDFIERERIEGNIFHPYGLGGYLIFRLYPKHKVFIDGRIYPYPFALFQLQKDAFDSREVFERLRSQYDVRAVLLQMADPDGWRVLYGLMHSPAWAAVCADESGALFLARGAGNDSVIQRYEMDLLKDPPQLFTPSAGREFHWWNRAEYPFGPINWAQFYQKSGRTDLAARALKPALNYRLFGGDYDVWYGALLVQIGNSEEGLGIIKAKLSKDPENILALGGLSDYYIKASEFGAAEEILLSITKLEPGSAKAWNTLGEIAFKRRDYKTAADRFRKATELEPGEGGHWEKLGMSLQYVDVPGAREAYGQALKIMNKTGAPPDDIERVRSRIMKIQ